jgi:hypothetical protein
MSVQMKVHVLRTFVTHLSFFIYTHIHTLHIYIEIAAIYRRHERMGRVNSGEMLSVSKIVWCLASKYRKQSTQDKHQM